MIAVVLATIVLTLASVVGCGGSASASSEAEEDEQQEELAEVEVGAFSTPLPVDALAPEHSAGHAARHELLFRFTLLVVVPPDREDDVEDRVQTHGARLREDVIQACRTASLDELTEPALGTLKAKLKQVLARYLGERHLRRVVLTNVLLETT